VDQFIKEQVCVVVGYRASHNKFMAFVS